MSSDELEIYPREDRRFLAKKDYCCFLSSECADGGLSRSGTVQCSEGSFYSLFFTRMWSVWRLFSFCIYTRETISLWKRGHLTSTFCITTPHLPLATSLFSYSVFFSLQCSPFSFLSMLQINVFKAELWSNNRKDQDMNLWSPEDPPPSTFCFWDQLVSLYRHSG